MTPMKIADMSKEFKEALIHATRKENMAPVKGGWSASEGLKRTLFYNEPKLLEFIRDVESDENLGELSTSDLLDHSKDPRGKAAVKKIVDNLYKKHKKLFKSLGFPRSPWDLGYMSGDESHRAHFLGAALLLRGDASVDDALFRKGITVVNNLMENPDPSHITGIVEKEVVKESIYEENWWKSQGKDGIYYHSTDPVSYELLPLYKATEARFAILEHRRGLSHEVGSTSRSEAMRRIETLTRQQYDKEVHQTFHTKCRKPHKIIKALNEPSGFLPPLPNDEAEVPRFNELEPRYFAHIVKHGYDALPESHRFRKYSKTGMPKSEFFFIDKFMHHLVNPKEEDIDVKNYIETLLAVKLRYGGNYPAIIMIYGRPGTGKNFFSGSILKPLFEATTYVENKEQVEIEVSKEQEEEVKERQGEKKEKKENENKEEKDYDAEAAKLEPNYESKYGILMKSGLKYSIGASEFLNEKFTWTENHVLIIDEATTKINDTNAMMNRLKMLSGDEDITLRKMFVEGYNIPNNITVFLFLNDSTSFSFEVEDRRTIICNPEHKLDPEEWLKERGYYCAPNRKARIGFLKELVLEELLAFGLHLHDIIKSAPKKELTNFLHSTEDVQTNLLEKLNENKLRGHALAYALKDPKKFGDILSKLINLNKKELYENVVKACTVSQNAADKDHISLNLIARIYNVLGDRADDEGLAKARDNVRTTLYGHHIKAAKHKIGEDHSYYVEGLTDFVRKFNNDYEQRETARSKVVGTFDL